eukprot:6147310-Amphidinium_carterae.2
MAKCIQEASAMRLNRTIGPNRVPAGLGVDVQWGCMEKPGSAVKMLYEGEVADLASTTLTRVRTSARGAPGKGAELSWNSA